MHINGGNQDHPEFGEALAFYSVTELPDTTEAELLVVYHPITAPHQVLRRWQGTWSDSICTARVSSINAVVGIWNGPRTKQVHILRKHPGLAMLSNTDRGNQALVNEDIERGNAGTDVEYVEE